MFHLLHCFLCILWNNNLLPTILVVVTSIHIVHFDRCIWPKYIFDGSWGKWGEERKLQEGVYEPSFDSRFGGTEATGCTLYLQVVA